MIESNGHTAPAAAWCHRMMAADLSVSAKLVGVWFALLRSPHRQCEYGCECGSPNDAQCARTCYREISDATGLSRRAVAVAVPQLVDAGWLTRVPMPGNHGANAYRLTAAVAEQ